MEKMEKMENSMFFEIWMEKMEKHIIFTKSWMEKMDFLLETRLTFLCLIEYVWKAYFEAL